MIAESCDCGSGMTRLDLICETIFRANFFLCFELLTLFVVYSQNGTIESDSQRDVGWSFCQAAHIRSFLLRPGEFWLLCCPLFTLFGFAAKKMQAPFSPNFGTTFGGGLPRQRGSGTFNFVADFESPTSMFLSFASPDGKNAKGHHADTPNDSV